jgi:predicted Fe-Mo cluster-binding NifX family protein
MKIAVPFEDGTVNQHFGRAGSFLIAEVSDGALEGSVVLAADGLQHDHAGVAGFLREKGVDVILAGNMGPPMRQALRQAGFEVLCGASGPALDAVESYLSGEFEGSDNDCGHGHGHGHGHGDHGNQGHGPQAV